MFQISEKMVSSLQPPPPQEASPNIRRGSTPKPSYCCRIILPSSISWSCTRHTTQLFQKILPRKRWGNNKNSLQIAKSRPPQPRPKKEEYYIYINTQKWDHYILIYFIVPHTIMSTF
jgi:hypothetical protein